MSLDDCCPLSKLAREQRRVKKAVNAEMHKRAMAPPKLPVHKILVCGGPGSGKSTFVKQMLRLFDEEYFTSDDRESTKVLQDSVVESAQASMAGLLQALGERNLELTEPSSKKAFRVFNEEKSSTSAKLIAMKKLWDDPLVRKCYDERYSSSVRYPTVVENTPHFMKNLDRYAKEEFEPSGLDIINTYIPTTGIQEFSFKCSVGVLHIFDVSGMSQERTKWLNVMGNMTAIIFVIDISRFDEDGELGFFNECMQLLRVVYQSPLAARKPLFVVFSKFDVLEERLQNQDLASLMPGYDDVQGHVNGAAGFLVCKVLRPLYPLLTEAKPVFPQVHKLLNLEEMRFLFRLLTLQMKAEETARCQVIANPAADRRTF